MPDTRVVHNHVAHSVYGPTGPRNDMPGGSPRLLTTKLTWKAPVEPPQSIQEHIEQVVGRIKGLSPSQRNSVRAAVTEMTRDLSFIRHVMAQMPSAPVQDEGRIL